jgi:2-dehydro-3-deoxyphosphogluconate aldolase / (4S)-4-hydroxy-2-oxoglutarate aldolase
MKSRKKWSAMGKLETIRLIHNHKLIAIMRGIEEKDLIETVQAMIDGGIRLLEVTFDHKYDNCIENTTSKIKKIIDCFGDQLCVGTGTVLTKKEVEAAVEAGAQFIISPNVDELVIKKTNELNVVSIPGAFTPTEAVLAYAHGADFVKLFPAGEIGKSYISALIKPLEHIPFLAVGGITPENVKEYLDLGVRGVGVSGSLVNKEAIKNRNYKLIKSVAEKFTLNIKNNPEGKK